MKNSPCKENGIDCTERHVGCHSTCEKYLEWKAGVEQANANRFAYNESKVSVWNGRRRK